MPILPPTDESIARAADVLRAGGLVAFPTETVYGLGADATSAAAVAGIFAAKGRPATNPLIVHVADEAAARALAAEWPERARRLAERFWPGPLTLVVRKVASVPDAVTAGLPNVALRVPAHPVALRLLGEVGRPIAAPSANRSTAVSPTTAQHVAKSLGDRVAVILDGGATPVGIESTVVLVAGARPTLLRPGTITARQVEEALGEPVVVHPGVSTAERGWSIATSGAVRAVRPTPEDAPMPSPGMMERHYSPRAVLRLVPASARAAAVREAAERAAAGARIGALLLAPWPEGLHRGEPMPHDAAGYARALYAALHALDDAGCDVAYVDEVPAGPEWSGVRDRLRRAAAR